ncbi:hypothetical protein H0H92_010116 [Tricholoma furcatifolium]|nr:hypothetical protein H0H92_010116 [Tricholoma furcatifolium]
MSQSQPKAQKAKIGEDGLTKYQRYYQRHPEVKVKNRERERRRREEMKGQTQLEGVKGQNGGGVKAAPSDWMPGDEYNVRIVPGSAKPAKLKLKSPAVREAGPIPRYLPRDFEFQPTRVWPVKDDTSGEDALDRLNRLRDDVVQWSHGWGGLDSWSVQLDYSYEDAVEREGPFTPRWRASMFTHARVGRDLLNKLRTYDLKLPREPWMQEEIWRLRIELAERLVKGITLLEVKTSILPGICNVDHAWDQESAKSTDESETDETYSEERSVDGEEQSEMESESGDMDNGCDDMIEDDAEGDTDDDQYDV